MQGTYYNRPMYAGVDGRLGVDNITSSCESLPYTTVYKGDNRNNLSNEAIKNGRKRFTTSNILINDGISNLSAIRLLKNDKFSKEQLLRSPRSMNEKENSPERNTYENVQKIRNGMTPIRLTNGYVRKSFTNLESRNSNYDKPNVVSTSMPNGLRYPFMNSCGAERSRSRSFYQHYLKYLEDEGEDSCENSENKFHYKRYGHENQNIGHRKGLLSSKSGTKEQEEIPKYELYNPDLMCGSSSDSLHGDDRCSFGNIPNKMVLKNLITPKKKDCKCSVTTNSDFDDIVCGWESKSHMDKYQRPAKGKVRRNPYIGIPPSYRRFLCKENDFEFQHYDDIHDYIRQYRYNHTIGDVCRPDEDGFPIASPDPYITRLKTNAADPGVCQQESQGRDIPRSDEEGTEDGDNTMSVDDRGRGINLAPVRRMTTRPRVGKTDVKRPKRSQTIHSQYLNLVIPKTTLHRTNLQLNITRELGPAFEPSKQVFVPYKPIMKRTNSADVELFRKQKPDSVRNVASSPGNRASDLRFSRSNTIHGNPSVSLQVANVLGSEPGTVIPPHRMMSNPSSAGRMVHRNSSSRSSDGRGHTLAMPNKEDMKTAIYNKINEVYARTSSQDHVQEIWEGGDRLIDTKDKVIAVGGSGLLGIRGKTCNSEDHVTLAYKLRKDRQRRVGTSAIN